MQPEIKNCQACKKDFVIESDDFSFYQKIQVPPPTFCSECRNVRRMAWRNEKGLFLRNDNTPGQDVSIISIYPDSSNVVVYNHDFWWSDQWDSKDFALNYDFSKTFFEQFKELLHTVPLIDLFDSKGINTRFCNTVVEHKNCYMVSAGWNNEDSLYSNRISFCKETVDCYTCHKLEFCYENINCKDSYKLFYSENSQNCTDSYFLFDCKNCTNCALSTNLRNKSFCILNVQYTKEEYYKKLSELKLNTREGIEKTQKEFNILKSGAIHRYAILINCQNTTGDNIENARDVRDSFDLAGGVEHVRYCNWGTYGLKDSYDTGPGTGGKSELTYEGISIGVANASCKFGVIVWNSTYAEYCFNCYNLQNCFGCVSLRNASYCILNKQYTKEEYFELLPKIKEHMNTLPYIDAENNVYKYGEFFPIELSPFPYNTTVAQDFNPISENEARRRNYKWQEQNKRDYNPTVRINEINDYIVQDINLIKKEIFECLNSSKNYESCTKAFKLVSEELVFYQRFNIPIPNKCYNCRHKDRLSKRNPLKLWNRTCMCSISNHEHDDRCNNEFKTPYSPDRTEKVYCEDCYKREVL